MKKITLFSVLITVMSLFSLNINAQMKPTDEALKNLKPYPATIDDLERYVIYVEEKADENSFEVELIAGINMEVDCNQHGLQGNFTEDVVDGWGFNYYVFETDGNIFSTQMACPDPKTMSFVSGEGIAVRYNSRLPIVVYLPKGYELKYKIWSAGEEIAANKE